MKAQECETAIEQAEVLYEKGQLEACLSKLENCTSTANARISFQVYRLQALAYLGQNLNQEARDAAVKMLELNPRYRPNPVTDPADLIELLGSISIIPKFSLGMSLSAGTSTSMLAVDKVFMVTNQVKTYTNGNNAQFSVSSSYQLSKAFSVGAMLRVLPKNYELQVTFEDWTVDSDESLTYLQLPLMVKYSPFFKWRLKPFAQVGAYTGRLLYSNNSFYAKNSSLENEYSLINFSSTNRRQKQEWGFCGGLGINYKLGEGQLILQTNYFHSQTNIAIADERYNHSELLYAYYHLDDDLRIHNLSFSLGYSFFLNYKVLN